MIEAYLALGDSLSCDPLLAESPSTPGAASLLASELARNHSCGRYKNFARERSRMNTIWMNALPNIPPSRGEVVVTISTGLEDLIDRALASETDSEVNSSVMELAGGYRRLVKALRRLIPNVTVIGTAVPDPTAGEGRFANGRPFPSFGAILFNDLLKDYASQVDGFYVADVFDHLLSPDAWASAEHIQLSSFGCQVIATTWLGEVAKAGLITLKAVA